MCTAWFAAPKANRQALPPGGCCLAPCKGAAIIARNPRLATEGKLVLCSTPNCANLGVAPAALAGSCQCTEPHRPLVLCNHYNDTNMAAPAILDIEASGFGRASYPIEVGYVLPDGSSFCTLVSPSSDWTHWDPNAEQLHHISRDLLSERGRPADEVARRLNDDLRGLTVYSDGWANDYTWLAILFDAAGMAPSFKLENIRRLLAEDEAERWHGAKEVVRNEIGLVRHRASADARLLQLTVLHVKGTPIAGWFDTEPSPTQ